MKNTQLDRNFFIENRNRLQKLMKNNSAAVLNSNDIMPTNADGMMKFRQNSDLFYLSGILQEETIFLMYPESPIEKFREVLFIRAYNPELEVWEGKKLTPDEARDISGIDTVLDISHFDDVLHDVFSHSENIYLNTNEHDRAKNIVESRDGRFIKRCMEKYPLHSYFRLAPLVYSLRVFKQPAEAELTKKACELSGKGFVRVLKFLKPGVYEYEVEAEYTHEFIKSGYGFADYEPIIAAGESSCFLHYIKNDQPCNDGDVLLMDVAAECSLYNADMTRTVPVNGKFTKRQKDVYNGVLRAMRGTIAEMKPGKSVKDLQLVSRELIAKELVDLKLVKTEDVKDLDTKSPQFKKYYPHDVSHFLGLSVHDVGLFNEGMKAGMILTCEPGIYIREEKLGVRIENDILITKDGNVDLMKDVPVEADEIEEIMNSGKS